MNLFGPPGRRGRISALSRQIIFINIVALAILVTGVLYVQSQRAGLVDERMAGIRMEALTVASALAEYATVDDPLAINDAKAEPLLRQLMQPTRLRARIYARNGHLVIDTRNLLARNVVETEELPPLDFWSRFKGTVERLYDGVTGVRPFTNLAPYFEAGDNGRVYSEVNSALMGDPAKPSASTTTTSSFCRSPFRCSVSRPSMACFWFRRRAATSTTSCARSGCQ